MHTAIAPDRIPDSASGVTYAAAVWVSPGSMAWRVPALRCARSPPAALDAGAVRTVGRRKASSDREQS